MVEEMAGLRYYSMIRPSLQAFSKLLSIFVDMQ